MTNLSLGKHNTRLFSPDRDPKTDRNTNSPIGKSYWYGKVWVSGCTYKSRNDSKTAASPRSPLHDWQRTKIGKSVVHGTAFRKLNKLVCVFSRWLWSKQLVVISTGFCFSQAVVQDSESSLQLCSASLKRNLSLYSDRDGSSESEFQGLPEVVWIVYLPD